ncbi:MAG: uncharacterized protein PWQ97_1307 [Tepidanaerobacteraceae bacterium]|nr:uncharacterized protein [Tepidanaerobacteraceae bacterium]
MNAEERRAKIIELLKSGKRPLSGSELAGLFKVTRQVIVQDIAILRAAGNDITATSQGYIMTQPYEFCSKKIAVRHDERKTREELLTFVECGCRVMDVIVEHPLYGELRGILMLRDSGDVEEFMKKVEKSNAALLSMLTKGVHLHTVEALNGDSIKKAEQALREKGILLE